LVDHKEILRLAEDLDEVTGSTKKRTTRKLQKIVINTSLKEGSDTREREWTIQKRKRGVQSCISKEIFTALHGLAG
jgi:hypothetical protein